MQGNLSWCPFTHFRSGGDLSQGWNDIANKLQQVRPYTRELRQPVSRPGVSTATAYPSHLTTRLSDVDRCCQQCWAFPDMLRESFLPQAPDRPRLPADSSGSGSGSGSAFLANG